MRLLRPTAIIAAFLIVAVSDPPSLFLQMAPKPSQPKQPAPQVRQAKRSHDADTLAPAIKELLETNPLTPRLPEKASEGNASEDGDNPPADDAPIMELVDYWSSHSRNDKLAPKLSDRVRQRLLEACEDNPELFASLINYLPENADTHDRLYKLLNKETEGETTWKPGLRRWLRRNSAYFRDELVKATLAPEYNEYYAREDFRALARLDWNAARPILEKLASDRNVFWTPAPLIVLYEHAAQEGDSERTESYRALLKEIVENGQGSQESVEETLASLMSTEWSGQEEWIVSLFTKPVFSGVQRNLDILDPILLRDTDKWLPVISNLVGHNQRAVHKAAVRCMVKFLQASGDEKNQKEIIQKLIPWLTGPSWAAKEDRLDHLDHLDRIEFIRTLARLNRPEVKPGLIWILDYDETPDIRALAAEALIQYRDPRAIPALRRALEKEKKEWNRQEIVTALAECGGFSDDEMAEAVEAFARVGKKEFERNVEAALSDPSLEMFPLKASIGRVFYPSAWITETIQATEGLAFRLIERAKALRATEPTVARNILRVAEDAPFRVAEANLIERIGEGWADVDSITVALKRRDALRKSVGDELYGLIKQGGYVAGVAAAILDDEREHRKTLAGTDLKAQLALLAGARYTRDKLPVELVGKLLDSPDRALAKAAESYLEVEASAEARKLFLARRRGEAYILGEDAVPGNEELRAWEEVMRNEIKSGNGLEAIYALARPDSINGFDGVIIRVRDGKAEMSVHKAERGVHETEKGRNVRWLTDSEFEELNSFTSRQDVEDLGPESYSERNMNGNSNYEYLRLRKEGGRRIVIDDLRREPKNPTLREEISGLFYRLSRSGEFTTRYDFEDKIPGVEVVLADNKRSVLKVCAEGGEMRALIKEKGVEYRQGGANAGPEWREISSGKPGEVRDEPSACHKLNRPSSAPKNATVINLNSFSQPSQSDEAQFYATDGEDAGIWKVVEGIEPVRIVSGNYSQPVITPDGKWLVAVKHVIDEDRRLIRRNLESGEEFAVTPTQSAFSYRLAYVAAHGKVLLKRLDSYSLEGKFDSGNESYLLDPETGTVQPVKGEFRPLSSPLSRAPQSAGAPNLFWAAIYDVEKEAGMKFGRYDSKNFAFTSLLEFPGLTLKDDDIWIDDASGKIWFVYRGHLLRLSLPQKTK